MVISVEWINWVLNGFPSVNGFPELLKSMWISSPVGQTSKCRCGSVQV